MRECLDYFGVDKARHELLRNVFIEEYRPVDLQMVPEFNRVYKLIARATKAIERGQVYLSKRAKDDLDRCLKVRIDCILVIDGEHYRYVEEGWTSLDRTERRTECWIRLLSTLEQLVN